MLRRLGTLRHLLRRYLDRGAPAASAARGNRLLLGAAQILWLDVPDHAAVDLAVRSRAPTAPRAHYAALVNAVLRRVARDGARRSGAARRPPLDTPDWLMARWARNYGAETAHAIAAAHWPGAGA